MQRMQQASHEDETVSIDDAELDHLLTLARLDLEPAAAERIKDDVNRVLEYVAMLAELDTDDVEPLVRPLAATEAFREDAIRPPLDRAEALDVGRTDEEGRFVVPRTMDEGN